MDVRIRLEAIRFLAGVAVGALLWVGCASGPTTGLKVYRKPEPPDLTKHWPDTHPELRVGVDLGSGFNGLDVPAEVPKDH